MPIQCFSDDDTLGEHNDYGDQYKKHGGTQEYHHYLLGFKIIEREELIRRGFVEMTMKDLTVKAFVWQDTIWLEAHDKRKINKNLVNFFKAKLRKELGKYPEWLKEFKKKHGLV